MFAAKVFLLLSLNLAIVMALPNIPGGVAPADLKEAETELNASLAKLAAGDGPNYKLGKVYSATRQVVEGYRSIVVADLVDASGETKKCKVTTWSRPWLPNGIEVNFECDGQAKVTKNYSA